MNTGQSAALDAVRFDERGLVTVVAQQHDTGQILMVAWANREALQATLATGEAHYWSRSRGRLWRKGEESGHVQVLREFRLDCDGDAVLYRVDQGGGIACHTGRASCFFRLWQDGRWVDADPVLQDPSRIYSR